MPSERPGPELPEVRERIAAAIHGSDYGRTCSSCLKRADAVLDVLNPKQVGWGKTWGNNFGTFHHDDEHRRECDRNGDHRRCVPVFTLSTEPEDAGLPDPSAEPCAPAVLPASTKENEDGK